MAKQHVSQVEHSRDLTGVFVDTAPLLSSMRSAFDVLTALVDTAVQRVPGCEHAGVTTVLDRGGRLDTPASTHDIVRRSDSLQAEVGQGPCYDAIWQNDTFRVDDMAGETRWPRYAPSAAKLGLGSALGFRLYTREDTLAVLNLYATTPYAFDDASEETGAVLAAHAALALTWSRTDGQLHHAMRARQEIGEAVGVLMERNRLTAEQAVEMLRQGSMGNDVDLRDVARRVTETGEEPLPSRRDSSAAGPSEPSGEGPPLPQVPPDEKDRLAAVRRYGILDTPPDGAFDRICGLAARFCNTPIATVTIVDEDRVWFKAAHGVDATEIPRGPGLCASAIQSDDLYVVTDAAIDPHALNNPLVRGELGLRFYAAAPIVTGDGYRLGTVNVIDTKPREAGASELSALQDLAGVVANELELQMLSLRSVEEERLRREGAQQENAHLTDLVDTLRQSLLPPRLPAIPGVELAAHYHPASLDEIGGDFYDVFPIGGDRWNLVLGDVCGKGPSAAALNSLARHTLRTAGILNGDPVADLRALNEALLMEETGPGARRFCTAVCARMQPTEEGVRLTVADGGHPPVAVVRADGTVDDVKGGGMLVGALPDATFVALDVDLRPGDIAVFYTDGITEARTRDGSFFGSEGLARALSPHAGRPAGEVIAGLRRLLADFYPPPTDDFALLALSVSVPGGRN